MEALAAASASSSHAPSRDHVRYVIDVQERFYVPRFHLAAYIVPVIKGAFGAPKTYDLPLLATGSAKHITPADRTIGRLVNASGLHGGLGHVSPAILGTLLELLIETGRLHWQTLRSAPLQRDPIARAQLAWRQDDDGRQRLHVDGSPGTVLIGSAPLWYVDPDHAHAGPVEVAIKPEIAATLATAPAMTEEQARRVQISLRQVLASIGVEGPRATVDVRVIEREPTPLLHLRYNGVASAELEFAYGDHVVRLNDDLREITVTEHGVASTWPRRSTFEKQTLKRLNDIGFIALGSFADEEHTLLRLATDDAFPWVRFIGGTVPELRKEGWLVEIDERFPHAVVDADEEWHADLSENEQRWFELGLGIDVEGQRISLLPLLIDALAENGIRASDDLSELAARSEPIYGKLPNGKYVALPPSRIARVLATLVDLFDGADALTAEGRLKIKPVQAAALADLSENLNVHWTNALTLQRLVSALGGLDRRTVSLPEGFKTELRPYQREGVAWLQTLREHGYGGVLADDMGLGKTVQLLAHVAIERAAGRLHAPVLIVAPTSVVPNWRNEIARFVPELRVLSLTGSDRAERFDQIEQADLVLTTYALLSRDTEQLLAHTWSIAVLDEAQAVKNPRVKAALVATQLHAEQRIAMTGTPIENHLEELWSIYSFAVPGLLGERGGFTRLFRTPIEKRGDALRRSTLASRLRPFLLRRTKERVARELPEKTEIVQRVELAGAQRDLYETIRLAMHKRVRDEVARRGLARSRIVVLDALLKLRQVCCDPRLLRLPAAAGVHESHKLDALLDMLESLIEDGRRILLFSQFTSMLDLMKPEITKRNLEFVELRGSTRDRETPVARFQAGEVPLFLISLKAGGTGLNLTAADTVIHYDPWWNPAVERQATDRAHRIGQEQHVFVYKFIAEGTVEERILELQERKGMLAASLFEEASAAPLRLEFEDIESLFS